MVQERKSLLDEKEHQQLKYMNEEQRRVSSI